MRSHSNTSTWISLGEIIYLPRIRHTATLLPGVPAGFGKVEVTQAEPYAPAGRAADVRAELTLLRRCAAARRNSRQSSGFTCLRALRPRG
jgi:hypothetical protein